MGTSCHSSTRPPGHRPAPRPLRRIAEADEHSRIVGRRVAAVGHAARRTATSERLLLRDSDARARACPRGRADGLSSGQPQPDPVRAVADVVDRAAAPGRCCCRPRRRRRRRCRCRRTPRRGRPPSSWNTAPARAVTSSNRPLPRLRNSCFRWCSGNGSFACASASIVCTAPLTVRMSSQPSLSKSNQAAPKPVYGRLASAEPDARAPVVERPGAVVDVEIAALAGQLGDEQVLVAVVVEVAGVDAHARLRPRPRRSARRPTSSAVFLNVPLRWLIHSWFGWPSLAT